jgi:predicted DNA-binding transcriptional regulator AlpA
MQHHLDRRAERLTTAPAPDPDRYMTRAQLAEWLEVSPATLAIWDVKGHGPKITRLAPGSVRYRVGDVQSWLQERAKAAKTKGRAGPGRGRRKAQP